MPEGVSGICFVACKSESDERDNAAPCIGEVVQGVGDDGESSLRKLRAQMQEIGYEVAVGRGDYTVGRTKQ